MGKIIAGSVILIVSFLVSRLYIFHSIGEIGMLIGLALIVWGIMPKKSKANSKAESGYEMATTDNGTEFDVRPARIPFPMGFTILATLCCLPGAIWFAFAMNLPSVGFLFVVAGVGMVLFVWKGGPASKYREATTFLVGPDGIAINGRKLPVNDIHRLILRNHVDGTQIAGPSYQGPAVAYNAGSLTGAVGASAHALVGGVAATGEVLAQRRRMKIQRIAYRLDAEARGKATTLACGMDETTAYGLMTDVANILGMR